MRVFGAFLSLNGFYSSCAREKNSTIFYSIFQYMTPWKFPDERRNDREVKMVSVLEKWQNNKI